MTHFRWQALARRAAPLLTVVIVVAATRFVLRDLNLDQLRQAVLRQPAWHIAACLALTAASFACLAFYDVVGVRVTARGRVPAGLALLAGASGAAFANTLGLPAVSGTMVRAHLYRPAGLSRVEVARVVAVSWLALAAGNLTMLAGAELFDTGAGSASHAAQGLALEIALIIGLACLARRPREIAIGRWRLSVPSAPLVVLLMAAGAIEVATAIGAFYVLLPADLAPPFDVFVIGCIGAAIAGAVSQAPGGLGVFEASMTAILAGRGRPDLLAALLLYRLLYNLLPFGLAAVALIVRALWRGSARQARSRMR